MSTHVEGRKLGMNVTAFERLCLKQIGIEQRLGDPRGELMLVLEEAVRLSREFVDVLAQHAFNPKQDAK